MAVALTLDFVFQIALETEETGELFYESLAENTGDHRIADLCGRMVLQERDHYKKFTKMREHYSHVPPPLEKEDYIQNLINTRVIPTPKLARTIATSGNLRMALDMAIDMEEDSVRLYRELRQEMTAEDCRRHRRDPGRRTAARRRPAQRQTAAVTAPPTFTL